MCYSTLTLQKLTKLDCHFNLLYFVIIITKTLLEPV